jgi:hypothetical protein
MHPQAVTIVLCFLLAGWSPCLPQFIVIHYWDLELFLRQPSKCQTSLLTKQVFGLEG